MKSEEDRHMDKISYEKPTAVDLGPAAPVVGASCAPGGLFSPTGECKEVGNGAADSCKTTGNGALGCYVGSSAGTCGSGSSV